MFLYVYIDYQQLRKLTDTTLHQVATKDFYIVRNQNRSIDIRLRRRTTYPGTYLNANADADADAISLGYGAQTVSPDSHQEFLQLVIRDNGELAIRRDPYITLPLFYAHKENDLFIASNLYETVLEGLPAVSPCIPDILELLQPHYIRPHNTIVREIKLLGERELLLSERGRCKLLLPRDRGWTISSCASPTEPTQFRMVFEESLHHFVQTRLLGQPFALQASGGLDSSTLPLFMSKTYTMLPPLASLLFPGEFRISQRTKLEALSQYTGYPVLAVPINQDEDYPLSRMIRTEHFVPMYAREEIYAEPFIRLASQLQQNGIEVLCTGIGGDDILENIVDLETQYMYGYGERRCRQTEILPSYLTPKFREEYIASVPDNPGHALPLLPLSALASASGNNIYIERDIWPVSPFSQPSLYEFCQGLPVHFRANKNILRAWHSAHNFPEKIYSPVQNEHFGEFFRQALCSPEYGQIIHRYAQRSLCSGLGYIDIEQLLATLQAADTKNGDADSLFRIYGWLCLEINLQHSRIRSS